MLHANSLAIADCSRLGFGVEPSAYTSGGGMLEERIFPQAAPRASVICPKDCETNHLACIILLIIFETPQGAVSDPSQPYDLSKPPLTAILSH